MKNNDNNSIKLNDELLVIRSNSLNSAASSWIRDVTALKLDSYMLTNTFSSLIENGIGTSIFSSADQLLRSVESSTLSFAKTISTFVDSQQNIDQLGIKSIQNRTNFNNDVSNNSTYNNVASFDETTKNYLNEFFKDIKNINDILDESIIDKILINDVKTDQNLDEKNLKDENDKSLEELYPINKEIGEKFSELDDINQIELINELVNVSSDHSLEELLLKDENSDELKQIIMNEMPISSDFREILTDIDSKEIQKTILNIISRAYTVSNFSKIMFTICENDSNSIINISNDLFNVFSTLLNKDTLQERLEIIYSGFYSGNYKEEIEKYTRDFVDLISTALNVSSEEVLNNNIYSEALLEGIEDTLKSLSYVNFSKAINDDVLDFSYSNMIIKEI